MSQTVFWGIVFWVIVGAVIWGLKRKFGKPAAEKPVAQPVSSKPESPAPAPARESGKEPGEGEVYLMGDESVTGPAWFRSARGDEKIFLPANVANAHGLGEIVRGKIYRAEWVWNAKKKRFDMTKLTAA